jgi:hypothetical protein
MRLPAPVFFSVGRSRWHLRFIIGTCVVGLVLAFPFLYDSWVHGAGFIALVLLVGVCAWRGWHSSPVGCLQWGEYWQWSPWGTARVSRVNVVFDFQKLVLVCIRCDAHRPIWLWLEAPSVGDSGWVQLRRALVARASG